MIPQTIDATDNLKVETYPTKTYKLNYETDSRVVGFTDNLDAMKQAIYKIINTERYRYVIYDWNYGIELEDLFGMPIPYVYSELERRVTEALLADDRITEFNEFEFSNVDEEVLMKFTAITTAGIVEIEEVISLV